MWGSNHQVKRLKDVVKQVRRPVTPRADGDYNLVGVRLYAAGARIQGTFSGAKLQAPSLNRVETGDIIYNKMWASKGTFALIGHDIGPCFSTSEYPAFRPVDGNNSEFIFRVLSQPRFWCRAEAWSSGSTDRTRLNPNDFLTLPIPVPAPAEQRAIAEVLGAVETAIAKTEALIDVTKVTLNASLDLFLGQSLSASVPIVRLGDVIESTKYGTSAKCDDDYSGYPVLRIPNVLSGGINFDETKYAKLNPSEAAKFLLRDGDLLAVRTNGNPSYVGRMALISGLAKNTLFASYLIRIRVDPAKALPEFVWLCSDTFPLRDTLTAAARTSAGNFNINSDGVKSALLPLPSIADQRRIVNAAGTLRARIDAEGAYLGQLKQLRAALGQELLSGRLRLPERIVARFSDKPGRAA